MNRADAHTRPRCWPWHALFLLLPACFHTEYLPEDAGINHDAAMGDPDATSPPPDAFNPAHDCPASYDLTLPGQMSRYRLLKTGALAWEHSDTCNNASNGVTHLAVVETTDEIMKIEDLVVNPQPSGAIVGDAVLIGGVQLKNAAKPDKDWFGFDGRPLIAAWHHDSSDMEPNDGNGSGMETGREQFVSIRRNMDLLNDANGGDPTNLHGALCECDGQRIDPGIATVVNSYRTP